MKKLLILMLLLTTPLFASDQWDESKPVGTEASGTIDNLIRVNNEALDRLVINYKRGLGANYATAATLTVLQGEIAIPNAAGTTIRWRRTTGSTTVTWSDIDTGSEASSTTYYLYATADTDITGMVFKISTSSSAPSGMTYYRKIASFYNNSSSNIESVVSLRQDDGTDYPDVVKGLLNYNGSTNTINDQYNVSSVTDNGTGDYTVNWSTSFSSAYYGVIISASGTGTASMGVLDPTTPLTTSSTRFQTRNSTTGNNIDSSHVCVVAVGKRI